MKESVEKSIRVLIVDDHQIVLEGLTGIINNASRRMEVVGTADSCASALRAADEIKPDIIILDLGLGDESSIEIIPDLIRNTSTKVLVLTGLKDPKSYENSIIKGASGIISRIRMPSDRLIWK